MKKIDSHQHFWKFDPIRDSWIDDTMSAIQRDFFPADLKPLLAANVIDGCIAVQADQSETQNDFLLGFTNENDFIKGIVGWVDLRSNNISDRLAYYSQFKKLKGFRHVLQGETDRALMLKPAFMNGIKALEKHGFTYDILIFPDQLVHIYDFAKAFPNQPFVIDHIAKPNIKGQKIDDWAKHIKAVAQCENVYCKLSGIVTEANWQTWQQADLLPYLDVVFEAFGTKRLMFGSDWPVCNIAGGYSKVVNMLAEYTTALSPDEQAAIWADNAIYFYGVS